jgi:hypothetical protein
MRHRQHRRLIAALVFWAPAILIATAAFAGNPHFVSCTFSITPTSVSVMAKEAGLGDESQVEAVLTATSECINPGGNHPKAGNKEDVAAAGVFPVQNGRANIALTAGVSFQPECSPPMTVAFTDLVLTDITHGISCEP